MPSDLTDRARLNRALAALRRQGLVVRREFKCCSSCACAQIWSELQPTAESDRPWGFVYYTQQDARGAADGHGLYIRYTDSRNERSDESVRVIASAIVEVLHDAGLQPEWDGDPERCVYLPLDWSLPPRHRAPARYGARSFWLALDRT